MQNYRTTFHDDGTVTYWSVYKQVWVRNVTTVPDAELAAWDARDRERWADIFRCAAESARELALDLIHDLIVLCDDHKSALGYGGNATGMGFAITYGGRFDCSRIADDVREMIAARPESAHALAVTYLQSARLLQDSPDVNKLRSALWRAVDAGGLFVELCAASLSAEPRADDEPFMYDYPTVEGEA